MKNERERLILFWFSFYSLFSAWKIGHNYMAATLKDTDMAIVYRTQFRRDIIDYNWILTGKLKKEKE